MRNVLMVCAVLLAIASVLSGNLWVELRAARQQIADLENQLKAKTAGVQLVPGQAPSLAVEAPAAQSAEVQPPGLRPFPPPANVPPTAATVAGTNVPPPAPRNGLVPVPAPAPERPVGLPTLVNPLTGRNAEEQRAEAFAQSDRTATARVSAWRSALTLTPEQYGVLLDITKDELRRETDESLRITTINAPVDPVGTARLKVETVNRQYETLTRIADRMEPQLPAEESKKMRTMFDRWLSTNMARARLEEQAALSGR